jgi:putative transposase
MLSWAHRNGVTTDRAWQPSQKAYVESFNGRVRDECLNEH